MLFARPVEVSNVYIYVHRYSQLLEAAATRRDFLQLFLVQLNKIFSLLWCVTTYNWAEHSDCICNNDIANIDVKTEDSLLAGNQFLANTATRVVTLHSLHWRQERGHKTPPSLLANTLPTVVLVWITIILTDHRAHPLYRREKLL